MLSNLTTYLKLFLAGRLPKNSPRSFRDAAKRRARNPETSGLTAFLDSGFNASRCPGMTADIAICRRCKPTGPAFGRPDDRLREAISPPWRSNPSGRNPPLQAANLFQRQRDTTKGDR